MSGQAGRDESAGYGQHGVKAAAAPPWRYAPALTPRRPHPEGLGVGFARTTY